MRLVTVLVYVMCLIEKGTGNLSTLQEFVPKKHDSTRNHDVSTQSQLERLLPKILDELLPGPLKERRVTLVLEEDSYEGYVSSDDLLRSINGPVFLLQLPKLMPASLQENLNVSLLTDEEADEDSENKNEIIELPLEHSVIIMVLTSSDASWWPLWNPPTNWLTDAMILLSSSSSCSPETYLQTPLLENQPALALFCPFTPRRRVLSDPPVYKIWTWRPFHHVGQLVDLGYWNPESFTSWNRLFIDRFLEMRNKTLRIGPNPFDTPLFYLSSDGDNSGVSYLMMSALSQWLHFDMIVTPNKTWVIAVMLDMLKNGETDVYINYGTMTSKRNADFGMTVPYHREGYGLMLEIPPPLPRWRNVIYPFTWNVWLSVIVSTICTSIVYHLLYREHEKSFINNTIVVMQSILSNPLEFVPTQWKIRNFLMAWWMGSWFISMSYTSNLIAVLTIPVFPVKIQTVQELTESAYRLCMLDYGEFVDEALKESSNPTLSHLGDVLDMVPWDNDMEHAGEERCIEKVIAGSHAHTDSYSYIKILYSLVGHGTHTYSLKEQLYPSYLAFMVRKNTPWKYKFDIGIQRLVEAGLVERWYKNSMDDFSEYFQEKRTGDLQPLTMSHLQGPFLLYGLGLFISVFFMLGEILLPFDELGVSQPSTPITT